MLTATQDYSTQQALHTTCSHHAPSQMITITFMHNDMALYSESSLPRDSGENIVIRPSHPKEATLAHWTGGYATYGPHWPEGAHGYLAW